MSRPAGPAVPADGLLEKLMAAVRPEFRADVLVFDPADPVFGRGVCLVDGCGWPCTAAGCARVTCGGGTRRDGLTRPASRRP